MKLVVERPPKLHSTFLMTVLVRASTAISLSLSQEESRLLASVKECVQREGGKWELSVAIRYSNVVSKVSVIIC